jgi:Domain of unknown function (DUF4412)
MLMKRFCPLRIPGATLLALLLAGAGPALAQMPGLAGGAGSMNGAMIALFGSNTTFSARAEFVVLDRNQRETENMPLNYAFSNGKMRMDIDLGEFKSTEASAQFLPTLKRLGMDQTTVITRPDRKLTWSVFPRAKAYAETPMPKEEISAQAASYKFDKTPEGRETVDGHDCAKSKITLTTPKGEKTEVTIWSAADLRSFPIQMRMAIDADSTMIIKFRDLKLAPPDDNQFEVPGPLTKYDSPEALLDVLAKRQAAAQ